MTRSRSSHRWLLAAALLALGAAHEPTAAAPSRAESLARFDAGYTQCEQRYPAMRGGRDKTYAALYRLRYDDATRGELERVRDSATYKGEHRRAAKKLARQASTPEVATRLEQQCQALQREAAK
jgi:hypothetical protein